MNNLKKFFLFYYTLKDVGWIRIFKRIVFVVRKKIESKLFKLIISFYWFEKFEWRLNILSNIKKMEIRKKNIIDNKIVLNFLNQENKLNIPLIWEDTTKTRLWNFNLHYFDWGMELLEKNYINNSRIFFSNIEFVMDAWIKHHLKNYSDGWNSYTLSIRIRNWIWFFRTCPSFISEKRLHALWIQLVWLNDHIEEYLGGNHYLENLMTLVFGAMQFKNKKAYRIYKKSLLKLKSTLFEQILSDGGHEERSASYHITLLKRLIETALMIEITRNIRPIWLIDNISKMVGWTKKIRLNDDKYPRFNDCFFSKEIDIKQVIEFGESYLNRINLISDRKSFYSILLKEIYPDVKASNKKINQLFDIDSKKIIDLPSTGWTILRPGADWEIVFKSGLSCPAYLPAHAHSDTLTFDIFKNGNPVIAETGTSIYQDSFIRKYERSGQAHNIMLLSIDNKNYIEPLEVWDSFRAARKSEIISRENGINKNTIWAKCSFKPISKYLKSQERNLFVNTSSDNNLEIKIVDKVITYKKLFWSLYIHFPPKQEKSLSESIFYHNDFLSQKINYKWIDSWTSYEYGMRLPSRTLLLFGTFDFGVNKNELKLNLKIN